MAATSVLALATLYGANRLMPGLGGGVSILPAEDGGLLLAAVLGGGVILFAVVTTFVLGRKKA